MKLNRIAFTTLGCKVNLYDTEAMIELFEKEGYTLVNFDSEADIYVINTCTVTNLGDKKSRQMIRRAKSLNPDSIIVATGCYSQVAPDEVSKIEGINIVIGTKNRLEIVETVKKYQQEHKTDVLNTVSDIMKERTFEPLSITELKDRTRAYLKIQEGCNRFCTYCIIPFARGPVRSRKPEDVIEEVEKLAKNGFKEIVLTGIHILSYGFDLKNTNFIDIIKKVHNVEGIERIRFSSIEPLVITDEFIEEVSKLPKVCDHYHLSLQSGCNNTLARMKRQYTKEQYEEALIKLRKAFPNVAITTDMIVGFPGETEEDFIDSYNFAKKVKISKIHAFPYSPKKGTKAALFDNQILNDIKNKRNKEMIALSNSLNIEFLQSMLNKTMPVLFEREKENGIYEGHTTNYITVSVKSDKNIVNQILNVKLTEVIKEENMLGIIC
ncbi:tRNA (N(6)-L-threonylcarbamoyladenosine(37)-C(2))-methylthiotransferase MtaB [uncultured Tyzzerella sp.]|uniref:tRNA (N(6)-L-threonylcarbamoyladenosine(37)-C(2))- methylthiotransferase MtaB n=1 Tax=uncultured Tyzzerella sp. TaxID=2321398 RepID=UPI00294355F9|nr:tRNA (N(6)-L-threonylcarbamoyladenosine(37)-C(2))-methylthiotransferase MtaB [uncultured Tyzzerella sp.]